MSLGSFIKDRFVEATPLKRIEELQKDLLVYGYETKARNVDVPLPYTFLYPENVENSVAI